MLAYCKSSLEYQDIQVTLKPFDAPADAGEESKEDPSSQNIVAVVKLLEAHMERLFLHHGFDQSVIDSFEVLP